MLGLVLIGALVWAITLACGQSVIHVCPNGTDVPSCGAGTACETIKYAIEQRASAFTEIVLCDGEFGASSCNATIGGPISVTGAGLNDTIIDCAFEHPAFQYLGDPANMSFSGFTIRYAVASNASLLGPVGGGIGIVWSSPNIANQSVSVIVDNLSFINCSAGSLYVDGAFVTLGGGLGLLVDTTMDYFAVTVSNCTFDGNEVDNFDSGISFGAAFGLQISSPVLASVITIVNSSFTNNYATGAAYGAALSAFLFVSCIFLYSSPCVHSLRVQSFVFSGEGAIALVLDGSTSNCEVSLSGITVSNNYADYGTNRSCAFILCNVLVHLSDDYNARYHRRRCVFRDGRTSV